MTDKKAGNKKMNFKVLKRVLAYLLKDYKWHFAIVMVCLLVETLCGLQRTLFMRELIDEYIMPMIGTTNPNFQPLLQRLIWLASVLLCGMLVGYISQRIMVVMGQGTMARIRKELFTHMEKLPIKYFDTHAHGDIMSLYTNDIDTLRQLVGQSIPNLISSFIMVVTVFISMITLHAPLTLVSIAMIIIMMIVSTKLGGKSRMYFSKQQEQLGKTNGYIEEMISGQKVIKVFNHEDKTIEEFNTLNEELRDSANNANKYANIMMPIMGNLGHISYVVCAISGATMALSGHFSITVGVLITFLTLNRNFSMPITQMAQQVASIIGAMAGAERIFSVMDEPVEFDEGYVELVKVKEENGELLETDENTGLWAWRHPHKEDGTVTYTKLEGKINFYDVDFSYDGKKTVLHDIDLFAEPGQKIALVGSTGAGKTTITNLINRFYDIDDGKIRYDDININKIKKPDLRKSLGIVLQDTHLFSGTVMDNIRYGRLDATDEECIAAAKLARADGFIRRLPDGYNTMLKGDGGNLSQGQRQLLAIARCAVADPPAMILDEATSSIDSRTEKIVQEGMDALMHGRTTFVIAHRLSTVRNADCIMVLEGGKIIERGSHDDLIAKQGKYYQLYTGNAIAE